MGMNEMIAYCGLDCHKCGAFLATRDNDDEKRKKVAEFWSKEFGKEIKPQDINCDGCLTENGNLFGYCKVCEIRKCAKEKAVENCAYCNDYLCDKLKAFYKMAPEAKIRLDEIRSEM